MSKAQALVKCSRELLGYSSSSQVLMTYTNKRARHVFVEVQQLELDLDFCVEGVGIQCPQEPSENLPFISVMTYCGL